MPTADFRFYEELNDHLTVARRKCSFTHAFDGTPAVKDVIESLGVPPTEIDLILVDGKSVRFSHRLRGGERVAVYPMFERFDIRPLHRLRPRPLRRTRFVADGHLGRLARSLRLLGFDTLYSTDLDDTALIAIATRERRILLTRDVGLLKHKALTRGYRLRATDPNRQVEEVVHAFSLEKDLRPFTRCMSCNAVVRGMARADLAGRVPKVYRDTTARMIDHQRNPTGGLAMPDIIRKVNYVYVTTPNQAGTAARALEALRAASVDLLAFSGFPTGRGKAQIDFVTGDVEAVKRVARAQKWTLSRVKRAFLVQGTDVIGAALQPLATLAAAKINVIAADAVAAGDGRYGMIFWVEPRAYGRAAKLLGAE